MSRQDDYQSRRSKFREEASDESWRLQRRHQREYNDPDSDRRKRNDEASNESQRLRRHQSYDNYPDSDRRKRNDEASDESQRLRRHQSYYNDPDSDRRKRNDESQRLRRPQSYYNDPDSDRRKRNDEASDESQRLRRHQSYYNDPDSDRRKRNDESQQLLRHQSYDNDPDSDRRKRNDEASDESQRLRRHQSYYNDPDSDRRKRNDEPSTGTSRGYHGHRKRERERYDTPTNRSASNPQHDYRYDTPRNRSIPTPQHDYHGHHPQQVGSEEPPTKSRKISRSISGHELSLRTPPHLNPNCPDIGESIADILIPSKLPLPNKPYSPQEALKHQQNLERPVALVIDLTDFSSPTSSDWETLGVKLIKLPCRGLPDNATVNSFVYETMRFVRYYQERAQTPRQILVYCTHGYNRTGFMIVHYLLRSSLCSSVAEALGAFASARPPGIYNPRYVEALFSFYNQRNATTEPVLTYPEWHRNEAADNDDDRDLIELSEPRSNPTLLDTDLLGDPVPLSQQYHMQKQCCVIVGIRVDSGFDIRFPGSESVSLDRDRLGLLRENYYYVSWKADGCRYMMLIKRDGCYLINTNFEFRRVQLRFPKRANPIDTHHITLLDGEMVIDNSHGNRVRRYLVNDLIVLNGESLITFPFSQRWSLIHKEVIGPRESDGQINEQYDYGMEAFRVMRKDFWMLSTTRKLFDNFIPMLPHRSSGLIFQCWDDPYVVHTYDRLLYWKHLEKSSLNFLFELENEPNMYLWDGDRKKKLEGAHVDFGEGNDPWEFEGKIIKCRWKVTEETWEFISVVRDKLIPDKWSTYLNMMKDLHFNIDKDELLDEINKIVQLPMYVHNMNEELQNANGKHYGTSSSVEEI